MYTLLNRPLVKSCQYYLALAILLCSFSCSQEITEPAAPSIADEIDSVLRQDVAHLWYPLVIDSLNGGYLSDFDYKWQANGPQNKLIVSQARHVWTCSKLETMYPGQGFIDYAAHGVSYLQNFMWDSLNGGFHSLLSREGVVLDQQWGGHKTAYGISFGIYGLSAYAMATDDSDALELAKSAFRWLDEHGYDPEFGGYFQFITPEGVALKDGFDGTPPKDQNSSIHLLEAFTELYQVWPNDTLRSRLQEMLVTIRDVVAGEKAYMNLFFNQDWSPVVFHDSLPEVREANYAIDHVSFGHDIEIAYLMMEAAEILGLGHDEATMSRSKAMVDHVLDYGWDAEVGGIYDRGYYLPDTPGMTIILDSKVWWSQVEALNTLLIMAQLYPDDPKDYYSKFELQWDYIKTYLLDHEHGGILVEGTDKEHESTTRDKGGTWKVNYHTARSLMNCINSLRN
jgi:mannobiose 2-epimerase